MRLTKSLPIFVRAAIVTAMVAVTAQASPIPLGNAPASSPQWHFAQSKPPSDPPAVTIPPPAPAPERVQPDDQAPLTPGIRPVRPTPGPDTLPERKAEPKTDPALPKHTEAQPQPKAAPKGDPKAADDKAGPKQPAAQKPGLAVAQPRTPAERDKALADLYAYLATADDEKQAATVAASIERLWVTPGSDTINLLMQRAMNAHNHKNTELALKLLDAVVALAPDYAEGWNRRAYIHYTQNDIERALGDLRRALALDPNHFKALDGLIHILKDIGRKKEALQAGRQLLDVNPYYEGAKQLVDELARDVEGRGI